MDNYQFKPFEPIKIEPFKPLDLAPGTAPGSFSGCAHVQTMAEFAQWKREQVIENNLKWLKDMNSK